MNKAILYQPFTHTHPRGVEQQIEKFLAFVPGRTKLEVRHYSNVQSVTKEQSKLLFNQPIREIVTFTDVLVFESTNELDIKAAEQIEMQLNSGITT